jgi:hypothetical protein
MTSSWCVVTCMRCIVCYHHINFKKFIGPKLAPRPLCRVLYLVYQNYWHKGPISKSLSHALAVINNNTSYLPKQQHTSQCPSAQAPSSNAPTLAHYTYITAVGKAYATPHSSQNPMQKRQTKPRGARDQVPYTTRPYVSIAKPDGPYLQEMA